MIAARIRRGPPPGGFVIVISRSAFREWVAVARLVASGRGPSPLRRPPRHANLIGFSPTIEQRLGRDSDLASRCLPATFLRPAQALLGDVPSHSVGRPDGDRTRLDLVF